MASRFLGSITKSSLRVPPAGTGFFLEKKFSAENCESPSCCVSYGGFSCGKLAGARRLSSLRLQGRTRAVAAETGPLSNADRPLWFPGREPPPYLDGSLAGDFGFDPLRLGDDPQTLRWYVQAELIHCRLAMAGAAGILATDLLRSAGWKDLPLWFLAGSSEYDLADAQTLFAVQLVLFGFVEVKRWYDFLSPGSQALEGSFAGLESLFGGFENGYPGGPLFNPLGLAIHPVKGRVWKEKEIKNGRLAMVATVGFFFQAQQTSVGPLENLIVHLQDPAHTTIFSHM